MMGPITSWGFFYRIDIEAVEDWAKVTNFTMGSLGFFIEEPETTTDFRDFLLIMYGKN